MAVAIKLDAAGIPENPTLVLGNRNGDRYGQIVGSSNWEYSPAFNDADEITFDVAARIGGKANPLWQKITDFKTVWYVEADTWFEISVELDDTDDAVKHVSGVSLAESELSQTNLYDVEINTEDDILNDDYEVSPFYNPDNPRWSLLHRILYKNPNYKIGHVDRSLWNVQRQFSWGSTTTMDALDDIAEEIVCVFILDSGTGDDGKISRTINAYDLMNVCRECGKRFQAGKRCPECGSTSLQLPYGDDPGIIISKENLTDEVQLKTDTKSVKNCFRLKAGDDLMTAVVRSITADGTGYLWNITEDTKEDLSQELVKKLRQYEILYKQYNSGTLFNADCGPYNLLIDEYGSGQYYKVYPGNSWASDKDGVVLNGYAKLIEASYAVQDFYHYMRSSMMPAYSKPDFSPTRQVFILEEHLKNGVGLLDFSKSTSKATAETTIRAISRLYYNHAMYKLSVNTEEWEVRDRGGSWKGTLSLTERGNDDFEPVYTNTFTIRFTCNPALYFEQVLGKTVNDDASDSYDIDGLFKMPAEKFKAALKQYSYACLDSFFQCANGCISILIDNGLGAEGTLFIGGIDWNGHDEIYVPWYEKYKALEDELNLRAQEIETTNALLVELDTLIDSVHAALNFENYLGPELWNELIAYRREDEYSNSNFISDGLTNAELIRNAQQFLERAQEELYKSAELQHSISASLHDLLVMSEFSDIAEHFYPGTWIWVMVDGQPYRLRLLEYRIDWSDLGSIQVEFSDVTKVRDGTTDAQSVFAAASRMSSTYNAVARKADLGSSANQVVQNVITKGFSTSTARLVNREDGETMSMDGAGLLLKRRDEQTGDYAETQARLKDTTLAFTTDGWKTVSTAIGKFVDSFGNTYYGVLADTIIGRLIAGNQLEIMGMDPSGIPIFKVNEEGAFLRNAIFLIGNEDGGGILIHPDHGIVGGAKGIYAEDENHEIVFDGDPKESANFYLDLDGKAFFRGEIEATSGKIGGLIISEQSISTGNPQNPTGFYIDENGAVRLGGSDEYIEYDPTTGKITLRAHDVDIDTLVTVDDLSGDGRDITIDGKLLNLYGNMRVYDADGSSETGKGYIGYGQGSVGQSQTHGVHIFCLDDNTSSEMICTSRGSRQTYQNKDALGVKNFTNFSLYGTRKAYLTGRTETNGVYTDAEADLIVSGTVTAKNISTAHIADLEAKIADLEARIEALEQSGGGGGGGVNISQDPNTGGLTIS